MEVPLIEESATKQERQKGGLITMPFIIANESFEKVASYGLLPNMISYLINDYHMPVVQGTNVLFIWSAATNFTPIVGAFVSDSFVGRFLTILLGSIFSLLGTLLLWLTTVIPNATPSICEPQSCGTPTPGQYALLYSAFMIMSIGAGGIRPCSLAFGADQIDGVKDNRTRERILESFFGWYYATAVMAVLIAVTGIVYIQDHYGWRIGFGVPVVLMFLSAVSFVVASPLYCKLKVQRSLFMSFCQVISAAWNNRKLTFPSSDAWYHEQDSSVVVPTESLRFLNKACILRKPEVGFGPWSVCTVEQVEELKALIRVIPLCSSSIMLFVNINQSSFPVLQAQSMDRHLIWSFEIPAGSFALFSIVALMVWVALYDRVILPLLSKITGKPVHISIKLRMGVGLVFSIMAMVVSAVVEQVRKAKAIEDPQAMSAMWLIPQNVLNGLAEGLNVIGQTEFYYLEFPKSMSSIAASVSFVEMGVASLLASLILSAVDGLTKGEGKESWISSDINKGEYDKYYWLLAIVSGINLLYYLVCSWSYGPCADETVVKGGEIKDSSEEEPSIPIS